MYEVKIWKRWGNRLHRRM